MTTKQENAIKQLVSTPDEDLGNLRDATFTQDADGTHLGGEYESVLNADDKPLEEELNQIANRITRRKNI